MNHRAESDRIYLIGNPTRDRIVRGGETIKTLGGTVLYAGLFFARAGIPVYIVGKGDREMLSWIESCGIGSDYFTLTNRVVSFENRYGHAGRHQLARPGTKIVLAEIPKSVFEARAVLVGAVLMEVDPHIIRTPRSGLLMLDVQGFLRNLGVGGKVIFRVNPTLEAAISGCDILKADEHEAAAITQTADNRKSARRLHQMGPRIVIITLSSRGSGIFDGRRWIRIHAPKLQTVDPTGAGDVFDAAFLAEYLRTGDVISAGCFGTVAATLSVAGFGTTAVPSDETVRQAVQDHFHAKRMVTVERLPG
jgi:sugar/nucleoside kinase (ribokinase family)